MKFALVLVGTAVVAGAVGTVIPQVPPAARNNPAARADWLELQHEDFGALTTPMNRLDLFDIFHAPWFVALWLVIIISVTVCSVSRLRPTVRNVRRPPRSVPDSYFDSARYRANFSHRGGEHVIQMLRRRRYTVERVSTAPTAPTTCLQTDSHGAITALSCLILHCCCCCLASCSRLWPDSVER